MKQNNFNKCLLFGNQGEKAFTERCIAVFKPVVNQIFYEKNPDAQKAGYDMIVRRQDPKIEIKTRDRSYWRYKDILLETVSVIEAQKTGWLFYSIADYVIYLWYDSFMDEILDAYILDLMPMRKWIVEKGTKTFRTKIASSNGGEWHTENIIVPISDIPKEFIIQIDKKTLISFTQTKLPIDYNKAIQTQL